MGSDKQRFLCLLLMLGIFVVFGFGMIFRTDCTARNTTTPETPIYPGSTLINKDASTSSSSGDVEYEYTVNDGFAQVSDFYSTKAICTSLDWGVLCSGENHPFGKYWVQIHRGSGTKTNYTTGIVWDKCSDDGNWHISVE